MTPQEFARQCDLLASLKGKSTDEWCGKITYTTHQYESAAIVIVSKTGSLTVKGIGQRETEQAPKEYLLMQRVNGKLSLSFGDLYLRWVDSVLQGLRGNPSPHPINLGRMGSVAPCTEQLP